MVVNGGAVVDVSLGIEVGGFPPLVSQGCCLSLIAIDISGGVSLAK